MATYTLYVLGEDGLLRESLKAVSMLFDPSVGLFTSNSGIGVGSVASMGLLFSLLVILVKGIYRQELRVEELLLSLIVYIALVVPKDDVNIENLYTGTSSTVTNVPFGVAMPIALMSGLTKSLTEKMETAFSTVGGNSIAMTTEGFVSPLRLLTAIRQGAMRGGGGNGAAGVLDKNLAATINAFGHYCLKDALGNTMSHESFMRSRDLMSWYADTTTNGFTIQYDATNPYPGDGVALTCKNAGTYISAGLGLFSSNNLTATGVGDYLKKAFSKPITSGSEMVLVQDALKSVFSGATVDAQKAMVAFIWSDIMIQSFQEGGIASQDQRLASAAMTEAMERWRSDSAASGEGFARTMASGMSLFLFLFIALSPLVITVFMMVGWAGLKLLLSWFMFGVWTQSWLPVAAVINFYIQYSVQNVFASKMLTSEQTDVWISPAYIQTVYVVLADKLAMASNMLAATPIITLTLMTGSVFSLISLAGKTAGGSSGQFDSRNITPSAMKSHGVEQDMQEGTANRPGWSNGGGFGAKANSTSANSMWQSDSITTGSALSVMQNVSNALGSTVSDKLAGARQTAVNSAVRVLNSYSHGSGNGQEDREQKGKADILQKIWDAAQSAGLDVKKERFMQIMAEGSASLDASKNLYKGGSKEADDKNDNAPSALQNTLNSLQNKKQPPPKNESKGNGTGFIDDINARVAAGVKASSGEKESFTEDKQLAFKSALQKAFRNDLTNADTRYRQITDQIRTDTGYEKATSKINSINKEQADLASRTQSILDAAGTSKTSGSGLNLNRAQFTTHLDAQLATGKFSMAEVQNALSGAIARVQSGAGGTLDKDASELMGRLAGADTMHKIMGIAVDYEKSSDAKKAILGETVKGALLRYSTEGSVQAEGDRIIDSMKHAGNMLGIQAQQIEDKAASRAAGATSGIGQTQDLVNKDAKGIRFDAQRNKEAVKSAASQKAYEDEKRSLHKLYAGDIEPMVKEFESATPKQLEEFKKMAAERMGWGSKSVEAIGGAGTVIGGYADLALAKIKGDRKGEAEAHKTIEKGKETMLEPGKSLADKDTQEFKAQQVKTAQELWNHVKNLKQ